jgi:hypothetical protein
MNLGIMPAEVAVVVLSFVVMSLVTSNPRLSDGPRWVLLLLALTAGILAALRHTGTM